MSFDKDFWRQKKVFITGHTGFKGGWLAALLKYLEADVLGFSLPAEEESFFNKTNIRASLSHNEGDIRNLDDLIELEKNFSPDILLHLAAQPLVIRSYEDPIETYSTNIMGTVNILELIRQSQSIRSGVIITTDKCYENNDLERGYVESDPMGGHDPYSSSKGSAELVISSYQRSFFSQDHYSEHGKAIGSARAGNVVGGGDYAENRLIPDFVRSIATKSSMEIRSPHSTRPWQHVLEPLIGYLMVGQRLFEKGPSSSDCWNFGPQKDDIRKVSEVADLFCNSWGESLSWVSTDSAKYHEAKNLSLDINKAKETLGWEPKWNLKETIEKVVDWYKEEMSGKDSLDKTFNQISDYLNTDS
ncbi:MAG: CDP-glucose 4,6-dehydratase [SAR86 cluster bacterium]|jgi:CDP-glucose 4,6-dehydratase|nr:CDP-glucose 4,6-dehydratase [SAR86 cluster bacterium]|tara:strand:+ start:5209 stop:6285 length:1077 start_codon:yes stop_codon:yes gene_type:complete